MRQAWTKDRQISHSQAPSEWLKMAFPMYVCRAADVVKMACLEPHQALKARGLLLEYRRPGDGTAAFVSHQWCGRQGPDPHLRQLVVLQRVLLQAASGTLAIRGDVYERVAAKHRPSTTLADWAGSPYWLLWYDYFSLPQTLELESTLHDTRDHMAKAISSLASYIAVCGHFIVLAPSVVHEDGHLVDYGSWTHRGWCRFERLAHVLSCRGKAAILLVRNESCVFEVGAECCFIEPVGRGDFSDEVDRIRLGPRVRSLLERKLESAKHAGQPRDYFHWLGMRSTLFKGLLEDPRCLQASACSSASLEAINSVDDFVVGSTTMPTSSTSRVSDISPLLFAAALGDRALLQRLIMSRARLDCKEPADASAFHIQQGMQPMHMAAMHGHSWALRLLFRHRADVGATTATGRRTPAFFAASFGHTEALQTLLAQRADMDARDAKATSVLETAVVYGQVKVVRWLLSARASTPVDAHGISPLVYAAACGAQSEIVQALVEHGVPLERRFKPLPRSVAWWLFVPMQVSYRLGRRDMYSRLGYHITGSTPLLVAAACGHVGVMRVLLSARADLLAQTDSGLTMRSLYTAVDPLRPSLDGLLGDPESPLS